MAQRSWKFIKSFPWDWHWPMDGSSQQNSVPVFLQLIGSTSWHGERDVRASPTMPWGGDGMDATYLQQKKLPVCLTDWRSSMAPGNAKRNLPSEEKLLPRAVVHFWKSIFQSGNPKNYRKSFSRTKFRFGSPHLPDFKFYLTNSKASRPHWRERERAVRNSWN